MATTVPNNWKNFSQILAHMALEEWLFYQTLNFVSFIIYSIFTASFEFKEMWGAQEESKQGKQTLNAWNLAQAIVGRDQSTWWRDLSSDIVNHCL